MRALLLPLLLVAACAPDPADVAPDVAPDATTAAESETAVAFNDEPPPGAERLVITTRDGDVDLGLTDEVVYFRLNPKKVDEIQTEIDAEVEGTEDGLGRSIAEAVTGVVTDALRHAVQVPIEDVEAVRYQGGRLEFEFSGDASMPTIERDGERVEEAFAPEDAERFVEAFEAVKGGR